MGATPNSATTAEIDPANRAIVDTNVNLTNIVDLTDPDTLDLVIESLEKCIDILAGHCGPQAGYAMLVNNFRASEIFEPNVFTRDGIKTLSAVEFMSPLQKYIQDLLTYIGGRVDDHAKDGTTTSMLFSAYLIRALLIAQRDKVLPNISIFQMNLAARTVFEDLLKSIEKFTFTAAKLLNKSEDEEIPEADLEAIAGKIAFAQALSSSGGNVELALAMRKIFENSPSVSWESINFQTSRMENGVEWGVEIPEYDYKLPATVETIGLMNQAGGSEMYLENVRIIAATTALNDASMTTEFITTYLAHAKDEQPILIIGTAANGRLIQLASEMNKVRKNKVIISIHTPGARLNGQPYNWDLDVLAAIAGSATVTDADDYGFHDERDIPTFVAKSVLWRANYFFFNGIVEREEGSHLHPYYAHPEKATEFYTNTLATCKRMIEDNENGHVHNENLMAVYSNALNDLTCVGRPFLRLGGGVHDQIANIDVAKDVEGAIQSALKHGFLINGPLGLYCIVSSTLSEYREKLEQSDEITQGFYSFAVTILESILQAADSIIEIIYTNKEWTPLSNGSIKDMEANPKLYTNVLSPESALGNIDEYMTSIDNLDDEIANVSSLGMKLGTEYPVFQPIAITHELFKRSKELLLKFVITNKIIVAGGVVAGDLADK